MKLGLDVGERIEYQAESLAGGSVTASILPRKKWGRPAGEAVGDPAPQMRDHRIMDDELLHVKPVCKQSSRSSSGTASLAMAQKTAAVREQAVSRQVPRMRMPSGQLPDGQVVQEVVK